MSRPKYSPSLFPPHPPPPTHRQLTRRTLPSSPHSSAHWHFFLCSRRRCWLTNDILPPSRNGPSHLRLVHPGAFMRTAHAQHTQKYFPLYCTLSLFAETNPHPLPAPNPYVCSGSCQKGEHLDPLSLLSHTVFFLVIFTSFFCTFFLPLGGGCCSFFFCWILLCSFFFVGVYLLLANKKKLSSGFFPLPFPPRELRID